LIKQITSNSIFSEVYDDLQQYIEKIESDWKLNSYDANAIKMSFAKFFFVMNKILKVENSQ